MNQKQTRAAETSVARRRKQIRIISWISAPIVGALLIAALPRTVGSLSAKNMANVTASPNDSILSASARFVEIPGTANTRAWSDGATIVYARDGRIVDAICVGTNVHAWLPRAGTRLYCSDGEFSGFIIPKIAVTTELQRDQNSPAANASLSSLTLK